MTPPPNVSAAFFGLFCVNLSIVAIVALLLLCEKQLRVNARKKREHKIVQDKSEYIPVSHHKVSQREMILQQKMFQTQARLPQKFRPQKETYLTEVSQKEASQIEVSQKEIPLKEVPQKEEKCLKNICVASIHVEARLKKGSYSQDEILLEDMRLKEEEIAVQQERYTESIQAKMAVMQRLIAERERLIAKRNRLIAEEKRINSCLHNLFIAKLILINNELYMQRCRQEKLLYLLDTLNQDQSDMIFRREVRIGITRRMLNDPQSRIVDLLRERSSVFKIKILEFKGKKNRDGDVANGPSLDENDEMLIF